jgi:hypothetical protein
MINIVRNKVFFSYNFKGRFEANQKKAGLVGKITIGKVLKMAEIQPGDWVEITPVNNKITIKMTKEQK